MYLTERFFNILEFSVFFVIALLLLPQLWIIIKNKSSATTSLITWISAFILLTLGTFINFYIRADYIGMNIGLVINCCVVFLIMLFAIIYRVN